MSVSRVTQLRFEPSVYRCYSRALQNRNASHNAWDLFNEELMLPRGILVDFSASGGELGASAMIWSPETVNR
jgi:hypothetical protein